MKKKHPFFKKRFFKIVLILLVLIGIWNVWKPLPKEINMIWGQHLLSPSSIVFLTDTTYLTKEGIRASDQQIFDEELAMIRNAKSYIFVDMFLWNNFEVVKGDVHRTVASELANALIAKKKENKNIVIQVISDPINIVYGGQTSSYFEAMKEAGISVVLTNLSVLRDSNPTVSSFWRMFIYPLDKAHVAIFGTPYTFRIFPNMLNTDGEKVTLRAYMGLLNFKANHRKLLVTDENIKGKQNLVTLVTSENPHDGSSSHSNVAVKVEGAIAYDVLQSEKEIFMLGGGTFIEPSITPQDEQGDVDIRLVTDGAILTEVRQMIQETKQGDTIDMLMFYFSERHIISDLVKASKRGVSIRLILDPNKDAFGREKNGIPNRETAAKLVEESDGKIQVRWCNTHGEQCHGKLLVVHSGDMYRMTLGSANFTRRNIGAYNLETNMTLRSEHAYVAWRDASSYFEKLWNNTSYDFSLPYESYKDTSWIKRMVSWIMEQTGLGTF